jgi:hypothetical protein
MCSQLFRATTTVCVVFSDSMPSVDASRAVSAAGAVSAGFSPITQGLFPNARTDLSQEIGGTIIQATAGGLASVAGGGKFANGAVTGAFGYLVAIGAANRSATTSSGDPYDANAMATPCMLQGHSAIECGPLEDGGGGPASRGGNLDVEKAFGNLLESWFGGAFASTERAAVATSQAVTRAAASVGEWLGSDVTIIRSPTSDLLLQSADGTRQLRFDLTDPHGLDPHINVETFQPRNLYPGDQRMIQTDNIHVFPQP